MYSLKGFASIQTLINNSPGINSVVGELSTYAKTYSKEIGIYSTQSKPHFDLYTFSSATVDDGPIAVPPTFIEPIINVCDWVAQEAISGAFTDTTSEFIPLVLARWAGDIEDVQAGAMIELTTGIFVPEYISFKYNDGPDGIDNRIKVWFSDYAFRRQYDEFEIVIVPPITPIDDLIQGYTVVRDLIAAQDDAARMQLIQVAKDGYPDTITKVEMFDWSNPASPDNIVRTPWAVIIYGEAGNTLDNIKNALADYILANSQYDRNTWIEYIPDIFKTTEHIFVPTWDNYSIPNETIQAGLFSPITSIKTAIETTMKFVTYPQPHVAEHLSSSMFMYRSIGVLTTGSPDNRDEIYDFKSRFPDYVVAESTSFEFARMSPTTQNWVRLMSQLLLVAERMNEFSDMPIGITRLIREGVLYAVASYRDVQYLVVSQKSYLEIMSPDDDLGSGDVVVDPDTPVEEDYQIALFHQSNGGPIIAALVTQSTFEQTNMFGGGFNSNDGLSSVIDGIDVNWTWSTTQFSNNLTGENLGTSSGQVIFANYSNGSGVTGQVSATFNGKTISRTFTIQGY